MKHLFSDSFGVDHKVTTQRAKIFCLDYRRRITRSWLSSRPFRADVLGFILECHVAQLRGHISEGSASFYVHAKANCCGRLQKKKGGESRLFKFSLEQTPAFQALADLYQWAILLLWWAILLLCCQDCRRKSRMLAYAWQSATHTT